VRHHTCAGRSDDQCPPEYNGAGVGRGPRWPGTNQNRLRQADIKRIADIYRERATVERYSYVATNEEIVANDFNLNILRYVETFAEEKAIDVVHVQEEIDAIESELQKIAGSLKDYLRGLGL